MAPLPNGQVIIGGDFTRVNGVQQAHVARLNADGTLDSAWRPAFPIPVQRLAIAGDEVYLLGQPSFSDQLAGIAVPMIRRAKLAGDGQLEPDWAVTVGGLRPRESDQFLDMAVSEGFVYLLYQRSDFIARGRPDRLILARFFRSGTGAPDGSWKARTLESRSPFLIVNAARVLVDQAHVYVARERLQAGFAVLERFAVTGRGARDRRWSQEIRLAVVRGTVIGGVVDAAQDVDFIYLGGGFMKLPNNVGLARISKKSGRSDRSWPDAATAASFPQSLAVSADTAYFTSTGVEEGETRLVAFPTRPQGRSFTKILPFSVSPSVTATAGTLFLQASAAEPLRLDRVLRLDPADAAIDGRFRTRIFRPAVVNEVVRTESGVTYVAGRFDAVGDRAIRSLARFSADGKLDTGWTPNPPPLDKLFLTADSAYGFSSTSGTVVKHSLSAPGLQDTEWNPREKLATGDAGFITGAEFTTAGAFLVHTIEGSEEFLLRRVPLTGDGTPDPAWNARLTVNLPVLKAHAGFLYVAPVSPSQPVERFPLNGGGVRDAGWRIAEGGGASITADETFIYLTDIGGQPRRYAIAGTGAPDPAWRPEVRVAQLSPTGLEQPATIASLRKVGPWVYIGGFFDTVSGARHLNVARIGPDGLADPAFTTAVPFVTSVDDFLSTQSGPRWIAAFGETPVLGGIFEEIDGVQASAPVVFNALTPPTLTRSGSRVFAMLPQGEALEIRFFRVTGLQGGTLATSSGAPLTVGDFVPVEEGRAGLDFTPDPGFEGPRFLSLASATAAEAAATGSDSATIDLTATLPPRNRYSMATARLTVREGTPAATITVQKVGGEAGGVTFAIENGLARAGEHFTAPATTTLTFPAGDGAAVISVPLVNDTVFTGDKDFRVVLTGTTDNGILLSPTATLVTIEDDDPLGDTRSLTTRPALTEPPIASASLRVNLDAALGAWRLLGEATWHASGEILTGLTRGNYFVEFRLANGFIAPPARTVPVELGEAVVIEGDYVALETSAVGALQVFIEPATVANASGDARGQWRLVGETTWRDSGDTVENLPAGPYDVEFKPVAGRQTPRVETVNVAGAVLYTVNGTYLIAEAATGAQPQPLDFATVKSAPYGFVGQVHTPVGFASGTAVRSRVVLTVAHALFDDVTLSATTEARWYHQKARGNFEPPPQVARGWYIFEGYASQRAADVASASGGVGISTPESQQLDVAAMWFLAPCARGSFAGYLRTDAENDWLLASRRRILAGYPAESVPENRLGVLHATDPNAPSSFTAPNAVVRATSDLRGSPGMSGGPLFVEESGAFFPAGVFLGGTAQTLVRVIDGTVVDLINRGEISGNGGDNNVSGGITLVAPGITASPFAPTLLGATLAPGGAVAGGAAWRIAGEETFRPSGTRVARNPGTYRIEFKPVPGFAAPAPQVVELVQGQIATARGLYLPGVRITSTVTPAGSGEAPSGDFALGQPVTLVAKPRSGFIFSQWVEDGRIVSRNARLTFTVTAPRTLTAEFVPSSFVPFAGNYAGLHDTAGAPDGLATFSVTADGDYTGQVSFGGETYVLRGRFDQNGASSGRVGKLAFILQLDRSTQLGTITGQLLGGGAPTNLSAAQSPFTRGRPTSLAGNYTLLLRSADPADVSIPPGTGFATMTVSASGGVRFEGSLADGVPISGGSSILAEDAFPFYAGTFNGKGTVVGSIRFARTPGVSDAEGTLVWKRPPARGDGLYPAGFETPLRAVAAQYTQPPIDYATAVMRLTGGGLTEPLLRPLRFSSRFTATSSSDASLELTGNPKNGTFSGAFKEPGRRGTVRFNAAVFQPTGRAEGFFRTERPTTGAIEVTPAP